MQDGKARGCKRRLHEEQESTQQERHSKRARDDFRKRRGRPQEEAKVASRSATITIKKRKL
jgi:hypothetical protein